MGGVGSPAPYEVQPPPRAIPAGLAGEAIPRGRAPRIRRRPGVQEVATVPRCDPGSCDARPQSGPGRLGGAAPPCRLRGRGLWRRAQCRSNEVYGCQSEYADSSIPGQDRTAEPDQADCRPCWFSCPLHPCFWPLGSTAQGFRQVLKNATNRGGVTCASD